MRWKEFLLWFDAALLWGRMLFEMDPECLKVSDVNTIQHHSTHESQERVVELSGSRND